MVLDKEGTNYIANFRLYGAAFSGWMDFKEKIADLYEIGIHFTGKSELKKKGSVKYYEPTFAIIPKDKIPEEIVNEAEMADAMVQTYFDDLEQNAHEVMDKEDTESVQEAKENSKLQGSEIVEEEAPVVDDGDLPF